MTAVREQKKLARMKRNRESAHKSRERKKAHVEKLKKQIEDLTAQNLELAETCQALAKNNEKLRKEVLENGWNQSTPDEKHCEKQLD